MKKPFDVGSQIKIYGGDISLKFFLNGSLAIINEAGMNTAKVTFIDTFPGQQAEFLWAQCYTAHKHDERQVENETVHSEGSPQG